MYKQNSTSTKVARNNMIQIFRAISIIAVVMIHTTPLGECQVFCRPFINFAVATFLFLSGYLTKIENDNWCSFYKKRIIRVFIPYVIWSVVYTLPSILLGENILILVKNLVTAKAAATMYYIFVYIQFVLLTPLLAKLAKSKCRHLGWFVAPISTIIFKYYFLLNGITPNAYVSLIWSDACLGWFTFYYLGLLLGNKIIESRYSLKKLVLLYLISIVLQMAEGYGLFMLGEVNCGTQIKLTSILTSTLFLLIVYTILNKIHIDIKSRFLRLLGDYSFGIYLCHIMVMLVLGKIPYYNTIPYPLTSAIVIIVSFGCCYLGNAIFGKKVSGWLGLK